MALRIDQPAFVVQLEPSGAPVADPGRRLEAEIAVAVEREVERVAGLLDRPGCQIAGQRHVLHEGDPAGLADPLQRLLEHGVLGAIARGAGVREVGRDRGHVALQRDLAAQGEIARRIHPALLRRGPGNVRANRSRVRPATRPCQRQRQFLPGSSCRPVSALPPATER